VNAIGQFFNIVRWNEIPIYTIDYVPDTAPLSTVTTGIPEAIASTTVRPKFRKVKGQNTSHEANTLAFSKNKACKVDVQTCSARRFNWLTTLTGPSPAMTRE